MTTLRQLQFLVALDDTRSFSRASELCHVTQSTLSTGLKELEDKLGVKVAERTRQSVLMTSLGSDLASRARVILAQVQDLEARAAQEHDAGATRLRLGTIPTIGPFFLPHAIPVLRRAFPATKFYLREELTDPLVEALMDGRLDLLLIALPHPLPPHIMTETLFSDGYALVTPKDHALGNRASVTANDLADRQLLLLEKGHCLQRHALSSFEGITLSEDDSFSATSLATLVAMVEEDLGVTLLPHMAVEAGITHGHTVNLAEVQGARPREIALAWRRSAPNEDLVRKIGDCLKGVRLQ